MLLVSRKPGERIMVGNDIVITIGDIKRGKVVVGIEAPKSISIYREEVLQRMNKELESVKKYSTPGKEAKYI